MTRSDDRDESFLGRWSRRKSAATRGEPLLSDPEREPAADPARAAAIARPPSAAAAAPLAPDAAAAAGPYPSPATDAAPAPTGAPARPPAPTLDDVARLTRESDYTRFVARDVDAGVQRAALKKLFSDPHFNTMDGLDVYIDDYGRPDPLPAGMLRKMAQARMLGLFADETPKAAPAEAAEFADASARANAPTAGSTATTTMTATTATPAADTPPGPSPGAVPTEPAAARAPAPALTLADEDPDLRLQPDDAARRQGVAAGADDDAGRAG